MSPWLLLCAVNAPSIFNHMMTVSYPRGLNYVSLICSNDTTQKHGHQYIVVKTDGGKFPLFLCCYYFLSLPITTQITVSVIKLLFQWYLQYQEDFGHIFIYGRITSKAKLHICMIFFKSNQEMLNKAIKEHTNIH